MPPEIPDDNSISGASDSAPEPKSLRQIAEEAYDGSGDDTSSTADDTTPDRGDGRDARGRFAPKERVQEAGEAEPKAPSPEKPPEAQDRTDPAAQARSNQPPEHWSAEDRQMFEKMPPEAKAFLLRRHNDMEAEFTRKSQANAGAVQAVQALQPVFSDPDIARSMQENGLQPIQAIYDWARLHKGAVSADPKVKAAVLYEIAERMGFDPAKVFASSRQPATPLTPELQQNPAIRYVTDLHGKTNSDLQALRAEIQAFKANETARMEQEAVSHTRSAIDAFADEKGQDGRPLRPYFDRVMPHMLEMFKANPQRDLREAYETACWMDPSVRQELMRGETQRVQQQYSNEKARQAVKGNLRGITSPVSKPAQEKKGNGSLRDTLEASADEVGL